METCQHIQIGESQARFLVAATPAEVLSHLGQISGNATIFCDVDDTLITPVSKAFRLGAELNLIDELKKDKDIYHNFEVIISNWRLQRKARLMHPRWPETINSLKKNYSVYGLTKMDNGKVGNIASMETWRYEELKKFGINFTLNESFQGFEPLHKSGHPDMPSFFKGIFFTGKATKAEVISTYKSLLNVQFLVLVDDREQQLRDMETYCTTESIPFFGILFKGMDHFTDQPDPDVIEFQKRHLIEHAQWLEDEEAEESM